MVNCYSLYCAWLARAACQFIIVGALMLSVSLAARAESLVNYRNNVQKAATLLQNLQLQHVQEKRTDGTASVLREVRRLIPAQQNVELPNNIVLEVDNSWLEASLKQIEQADASSRIPLIIQTEERLGAIAARLVELETAQAAAAAHSKNEDKQKLDEILRRAEYQKPEEKEKSVLDRWLEALEKWWRSLFRDVTPQKIEQPNFNPSSVGIYLRYIVIALAVGLIAFLFWRFIIPLFGKNRQRTNRGRKEPRVILGETLAPDETPDNLILQAERLAQSGDVRAAIRKGYIAILAELSDRKVLGLAGHKTNRDYLRDVRRREGLYEPMQQLTNSFEQHWYGDVPAEEQDWQQFRFNYGETVKRS